MEYTAKKLNRLVGIPYGFRDAPGLDCYQFAIKALSELFNIDAPNYVFEGEEDEAWIAFEHHKLTWIEGDGSPGDVVLFQVGRYQHCGVCIGNDQMIHTLRKHQSAIEDITSMKWKNRIIGYYKWQS